MPDDFPQSFRPFVQDVFDSYDNINIMLVRNPDIVYDTTGRNESEQQARDIDAAIQDYFVTNNRPVHYVRAGDGAAADCLSIINQR